MPFSHLTVNFLLLNLTIKENEMTKASNCPVLKICFFVGFSRLLQQESVTVTF